MSTRRQFLGSSAALLTGATLVPATLARGLAIPAAAPLSVLVLGGTGFIGPHVVETALARGHRVTVFNRGSNPGMFGDRVEELTGDRDANTGTGLESLGADRRWDVVIDNSGYVPRHVRDSAELLKDRTSRYLFTSTVAVYDYDALELEDGVQVARHDSPLHPAPEPATERVTGATYGPLKAEADRIVREVYGERSSTVRPCYIVGPGDSTDRFTYWIERLIRGGDVVCPFGPDRMMNVIDVRDLASFMIHLAETDTPGTFNGVGPASPMSNAEAMHAIRGFCSAPTTLHWPSAELLDEVGFSTPMFDRARGDRRTDASAAVAAGLTYRSLATTIADTHAWWQGLDEERTASPRGWPSAEREAQVIAKL